MTAELRNHPNARLRPDGQARLDEAEAQLAAAHLTPGQWAAVAKAGAASVPPSKMLLVFGMFAYEGDPEVLASMLHSAPPPQESS